MEMAMAMSELPKGWADCQLEDILLALESGSRPKGGVRNISEGIPSVGGEHLNYNGGFDFSNLRYVPELFAMKMSKGQIRKKDILIVKDGATTGKTSFVNENFPYENAVVNEHVFICRTSSILEPKFVFRFLTSKEGQSNILSNFQGSAQGGINTKFISNTTIPLAPLNEQKRIVEKLDKLLTRVEEAKARLEKIPFIIKRFRQSVLNAAVTGELTKDWRERNKVIDEWNPSILSKVCLKIQDGSHFSPQEQFPNWKPGSFMYLTSKNIRNNYIDLSNVTYTTKEFHSSIFKRCNPEFGDVLLTKDGANTGNVTLNTLKEEFSLLSSVCLLKPNKNIMIAEFLKYYIQSPLGFNEITGSMTGSAIPRIILKTIKNSNIIVPSIEEQKEIVKRVEALFKKADEIEERYKKAKTFVDKLTQSILAKAFRGELVPQDPNDEPAEKLLERIKAEKEKSINEKGKKKQSKETMFKDIIKKHPKAMKKLSWKGERVING